MTAPVPPCRRHALPKPWLAALVLLVIAILALSGGRVRDAIAAPNETGGPYRPAATIETNSNCFNTEVAFQNQGGISTWCEQGGYVIYRVPTVQLPADATNVRYSARFEGYGFAAPAQIAVSVSPVSNSYPVTRYYALSTSKYNFDTPFLSWDGDWKDLNNGQVYVKMARSQGTVYWDNLHLVILYDTPNKADLQVSVTGEQTVLSGTTFEWTVNVTNHGPQAVSNIVLTTSVPAGIALPSIQGCSTGGYPTCNIGHIVSGGNRTLKFTALAAQAASGTKRIDFSVTGGLADPNHYNNVVSRNANVVPTRNVTVCTTWEPNATQIRESPHTFNYMVSTVAGHGPVAVSQTLQDAGDTACQTVKALAETLKVVPTGHDGHALEPGYPRYELFVTKGTGSGTATMGVSDWKVTFKWKEKPFVVATPANTPKPNTPTPTATSTPAPKPTNTPAPTNTPGPTNTPKPTNTPIAPTPPAGGGNEPAPTNTPPVAGGVATGQPSNPGGGDETGSGAGSNPATPDEDVPSGEQPQDAPSEQADPDAPASNPGDHPTSDAGGAVSSGPVVTNPTAESSESSATPIADDEGGPGLALYALATAVAMGLLGLGIVALSRRKHEAAE